MNGGESVTVSKLVAAPLEFHGFHCLTGHAKHVTLCSLVMVK